MSGIDIQDYHSGNENSLQDPTDPHEQVEKRFMDKLGRLLTSVEEALAAGEPGVDPEHFIEARGKVLDKLNDGQVRVWLDHMRKVRRIPFRKFTIGD